MTTFSRVAKAKTRQRDAIARCHSCRTSIGSTVSKILILSAESIALALFLESDDEAQLGVPLFYLKSEFQEITLPNIATQRCNIE